MGTYGDSGNQLDADLKKLTDNDLAISSAMTGFNQALTQLADAVKVNTTSIQALDARLKIVETPPPTTPPVVPTQPAKPLYGRDKSAPLTDYNANTSAVVTLPNGFKGSNLRIYGIVQAAGSFTLDNCLLVGPQNPIASGNHALFRAYNKRVGQAVFNQCTFAPQTPSNGLDCCLGWQYELYHCDLSGGVDGCGIYATSGTGSNESNVTLEDVWIHDLSYFYPDLITPAHTDGTHNDCVQIQGGGSNRLTRVKLDAYAKAVKGTNPQKPWLTSAGWANGAALTIQTNTGIQAKVDLYDCELAGGLAHMNIKPGVVINLHGSRHHYDTANNASPKWSRYYIRFDQQSATTVSGLDTAVFIDGPNAGKKLIDTGGVTTNA